MNVKIKNSTITIKNFINYLHDKYHSLIYIYINE